MMASPVVSGVCEGRREAWETERQGHTGQHSTARKLQRLLDRRNSHMLPSETSKRWINNVTSQTCSQSNWGTPLLTTVTLTPLQLCIRPRQKEVE
jgi:hypothetical protein